MRRQKATEVVFLSASLKVDRPKPWLIVSSLGDVVGLVVEHRVIIVVLFELLNHHLCNEVEDGAEKRWAVFAMTMVGVGCRLHATLDVMLVVAKLRGPQSSRPHRRSHRGGSPQIWLAYVQTAPSLMMMMMGV